MLVGRFGVMLPVLAIAGSFGNKKRQAEKFSHIVTTSPLFIFLLFLTVIMIGALPPLCSGISTRPLLLSIYSCYGLNRDTHHEKHLFLMEKQ